MEKSGQGVDGEGVGDLCSGAEMGSQRFYGVSSIPRTILSPFNLKFLVMRNEGIEPSTTRLLAGRSALILS